jgi:hypothetical protein
MKAPSGPPYGPSAIHHRGAMRVHRTGRPFAPPSFNIQRPPFGCLQSAYNLGNSELV